MDILEKCFNSINLNDTNYEEDDPDIIILVRFLAVHNKFKKLKELKKEFNEELMPIAWRPRGWWDFRISEYGKKEIELIFIE